MSFIWNLRTGKTVQPPAVKFSDSDFGLNTIFDDDYVHEKHITLNYTGKGANFQVKSKATIDFQGKTVQDAQPKTSSSTKFLTTVNNSALEAKFDSKGLVRLWNDLGTYEVAGVPITVTGKVKTNNAFSKTSWGLQTHIRQGDVNVSNRLHLNSKGNPFWGARLLYSKGDVSAGLTTKLNASTFLLTKLNLFGTYRVGVSTVYAELANHGNGLKSAPTKQTATLATIYRGGNSDYGVKVVYELQNKEAPLSAVAAGVTRVNSNTTVRYRVNNNAVFALSAKFVHNSNLNVQVGTQVTLNDPATFTRKNVVPVPVGVAINFSYN